MACWHFDTQYQSHSFVESGKSLKKDLVSFLNYGFTFFIYFSNLF